MKLHFSKDWLKKFDDLDEPEGCPHCGAVAGACKDYPNCPGGSPSRPDNLSTDSALSASAEPQTKGEGAALEAAKPKRKAKGTSPTQRSLEHMRELGYLCAVVEKWNPHAMIRQDLYGFIDVLCVKGEDIVGVQATSGSHVSERVTKITEHENWPLVCTAIRVCVHGWRKNAAGRWVLREVEL